MSTLRFITFQLLMILLLWTFSITGKIKKQTWKDDKEKFINLNMTSKVKMPLVGYGTFQGEDSVIEAALEKALEAGNRHIDTAAFYRNERVIGRVLSRWLSSKKVYRPELFIATKLPQYSCQPDLVLESFEESLRNLQLDYIDLYLMHMPYYIPQTNAYNEDGTVKIVNNDFVKVWKKMEILVHRSTVKAIGVSNFNTTQIEKLLNSAAIKPAVVQTELNVFLQEKPLVELCRKHDIGVTSYASLGSRAIYKTVFKDKVPPPNMLENEVVVNIAKKHNKTPAQVLLRFLIQQNICVIPYSTNENHIKENVDLFDFNLTDEEMKSLQQLDQGEKARILRTSQIVKGIEKHPNYPFPY